jgi:hypothetical protein
MSAPKFLILPLCLLLAGCTVFRSSRTWNSVIRSRPDLSAEADPSAAYAEHLHRVLKAQAVAHRVVTYQFRYTSRFREEAIETRTAVLYRDDTHSTHPWWLADERLARPKWLPNGSVEQQVTFAARHRAEIVSVRDFGGSHDGKSVIAAKQRAAAFRTSRVAPLRPVALGRESDAGAGRWAALFHSRHGTAFDPGSPVDRRKMTALQRSL